MTQFFSSLISIFSGKKTYIASGLIVLKGVAAMVGVVSGLGDGGMSTWDILGSDQFWQDPNMLTILEGVGLGTLRSGVSKSARSSY